MITLLASLAGFISSLIPEIMKYFVDKRDKFHEIQILEYQIKLNQLNSESRLEEIIINNRVGETQALYRTYKTGVSWIDALNGSVRPVLAYAFFTIYTSVKYLQYLIISDAISITDIVSILWSLEDQAIFASIISFYFGQRALSKIRGKWITISLELINFIKGFEGFSSSIYICPSGFKTIGYGHLIQNNDFYTNIDEQEANALLIKDIEQAKKSVIRNINISLTQGQLDALTSFTFNLGNAALQRSTLRQKVNREEHGEVEKEFMRWIYSNGISLPGLIKRRTAEVNIYIN